MQERDTNFSDIINSIKEYTEIKIELLRLETIDKLSTVASGIFTLLFSFLFITFIFFSLYALNEISLNVIVEAFNTSSYSLFIINLSLTIVACFTPTYYTNSPSPILNNIVISSEGKSTTLRKFITWTL